MNEPKPRAAADASIEPRRGGLSPTASAAECRAEWRSISTVFSKTCTATVGNTLRTLPGSGNRRIVPA